MKLEHLIQQMQHTAQSIQHLTATVSNEQAVWQPDPENWSILTVMEHLYLEERLDFRRRLARGLGLEDPSQERTVDSGDLASLVQGFMDEREHSLAWLRGFKAPDWSVPCPIDSGQISAGDMIVSWAAHDLLHLRQLIELHYAYTVQQVKPYAVDYAGEW